MDGLSRYEALLREVGIPEPGGDPRDWVPLRQSMYDSTKKVCEALCVWGGGGHCTNRPGMSMSHMSRHVMSMSHTWHVMSMSHTHVTQWLSCVCLALLSTSRWARLTAVDVSPPVFSRQVAVLDVLNVGYVCVT